MLARLDPLVWRFAFGLATLGGAALLAAMALTLVSTLGKNLRRVLDSAHQMLGSPLDPVPWASIKSILGEEDMVGLAMGFALFCALPLVQLARGHIQVDLFEARFPPWVNRLLDLLADLGFFVLIWLVLLSLIHI